MSEKAKDPRQQLKGARSKAKGKYFEQRLDASFEYYRQKGFADVEKTPEPMRPIKDLGTGKFIAVYEKRAQPDYKGVFKGGRAVMFEAKYTSTDRMEQSRVLRWQMEYMERQQRLGARCFIVCGFDSGEVYSIPFDVWKSMKEVFGRKYVTEADLDNYRVKLSWNATLLLLG